MEKLVYILIGSSISFVFWIFQHLIKGKDRKDIEQNSEIKELYKLCFKTNEVVVLLNSKIEFFSEKINKLEKQIEEIEKK